MRATPRQSTPGRTLNVGGHAILASTISILDRARDPPIGFGGLCLGSRDVSRWKRSLVSLENQQERGVSLQNQGHNKALRPSWAQIGGLAKFRFVPVGTRFPTMDADFLRFNKPMR